MARMRLVVPAELVELFHEQLQLLWEVKSETIMMIETETARLRSGGPVTARRALGERHAVDALLDQVPWDEQRPDDAVELVGDHELFSHIVYGMLCPVGGWLSDACEDLGSGKAGAGRILVLQDQLTSVLALLRRTTGCLDELAVTRSPVLGGVAGTGPQPVPGEDGD